MSTKSVSIILFGENTTAICKECGEEYKICDSTAWDTRHFCDGECEALSEFDPNDEEFLNTESENDLLDGLYW